MNTVFNVNDYTDREIATEAVLYLEANSGSMLEARGNDQMTVMLNDDYIKEARNELAKYNGAKIGDEEVPEAWEFEGNPVHLVADKYFRVVDRKVVNVEKNKVDIKPLLNGLTELNGRVKDMLRLEGAIILNLNVENNEKLTDAYLSTCSKAVIREFTVSVVFSDESEVAQIRAGNNADLEVFYFFVVEDMDWNTGDERHNYLDSFLAENAEEILKEVKSELAAKLMNIVK